MEDLTGDGAPDTLALRAFGHRGDSLNIAFTITSHGAEVFRESWASTYELIDPPLPPNPPLATVDSYIHGRLEAEFRQVHIEPFDTSAFSKPWVPAALDCQGDPRDCISWDNRLRRSGGRPADSEDASAYFRRLGTMPFDTAEIEALATNMRHNAKVQITLTFGYESTITIAWSPRAHRFLTLSSCC